MIYKFNYCQLNDVSSKFKWWNPYCISQRLSGATLLIFANKQDLPGAMPSADIRKVSSM